MIGRPPMSTRTDTLCPYPTRVRADAADAGSFATIDRVWREGDRWVIDLPMTVRLQPIDAEHPNLCALLRGPLVLHEIGPQGAIPRRALDTLQQGPCGPPQWTLETASGKMRLRPFKIGSESCRGRVCPYV